jgi:hypothetical protein
LQAKIIELFLPARQIPILLGLDQTLLAFAKASADNRGVAERLSR